MNRTLLGLVALVLLGGGGLLLVGGLDLNRRWHLGLPSSWTLTDPHHPVLDPADRTRFSGDSWWWPALFAALGLIAVLALWWLLSQLRRGAVRQLSVPGTAERPVRLRGDALARALADRTEQLPGVSGARVRLLGPPHRPKLRIALTLAPGAAPGPVLQQLSEGPLAEARACTGLAVLPAHARIRLEPGAVDRVR